MFFESNTLTSASSRLVAARLGAGLFGWQVDGMNLLTPTSNDNDWTRASSFACGPFWHGRLIAPDGIPATINFAEQLYQIEQNPFVNVDGRRSFSNPVIHGYWPNQIWTRDYVGDTSITFQSRTPESAPFVADSKVEYRLLSDSKFNCLTSVWFQKRGPYSCCHHPRFNLNPKGIEGEQVTIKIPAATRRWQKSADHACLLFNGMPLADLGGLDLVNGIPVVGGWDDGFLLDKNGHRLVELIYEKAGIKIEITFSADVSHVILCSPPGCDFIYIEPCIGAGNAVNLAAMGLPDEITGHRVLNQSGSHTWWWGAEVRNA